MTFDTCRACDVGVRSDPWTLAAAETFIAARALIVLGCCGHGRSLRLLEPLCPDAVVADNSVRYRLRRPRLRRAYRSPAAGPPLTTPNRSQAIGTAYHPPCRSPATATAHRPSRSPALGLLRSRRVVARATERNQSPPQRVSPAHQQIACILLSNTHQSQLPAKPPRARNVKTNSQFSVTCSDPAAASLPLARPLHCRAASRRSH
jgi:hypothetical protein